jgi:predicted ester cyclase
VPQRDPPVTVITRSGPTRITAALGLRAMQLMADGDPDDFARVVHPDAVNREAVAEPPECRGRGPGAYFATARWLRAAFADLRWDVHRVVAEADVVAVHCTMTGRHTGPFVTYGPRGHVAAAFPPTGRAFATPQTHWFRVAGGRVVEHWANRDDLGLAQQLGWLPPAPLYALRMAWAKRRARRAPA